LFNIIFSFSIELLDLLVKYGADVNMRDKYGNSILHDDYSGRDAKNFEKLLIALINIGFDINSRNSAGYTIWRFCKNEIFADILKKHHGVE
ncbi:MAG: ankyrin repeat domain-containing protein, partial [Peptostreptococcaceae bacterium]|nr:ankyrin repeat domain-containing protein [Peptostreptococcaceae bacterium]